ncbi:MAG: LamG-like jellyroll fold domain-containing protein [Phycisphaerales bacterium]
MRRNLVCLLTVACILGLTSLARADMIGWWTLDDGTGTVAKDSSGNGTDGNFSGTPVWVTGRLGGALRFDGNSYVDCGNSTKLQVAGPITIACWVNPSVLSGDQGFAGRTAEYAFKASGTSLRFTTPGVLDHTSSKSTLVTGTWQHVAATFNPGKANDGLIFYINGVETDRMTASAMNAGTGPFQIGSNQWSETFEGMIDDVQVYNEILPAAEIAKLMKGRNIGAASAPIPAEKAVDVARDVTLSWTAGPFAATHDVYVGTTFADVNGASRTSPSGVLVSQGQAEAAYKSATPFEYGQTYYWRIDEVNAAPDSTIFKGAVWSFTAETFGYPIKNVTATASSQSRADAGPENTVNGSGLNADDQHSIELATMWMSANTKPHWIQYEFDKAYKLGELWVWNANQMVEPFVGFGAKSVTIEYSTDGQTWATLEGAPEFARATGAATYTANTVVDFGGATAKFVKLSINSNWGGIAQQVSLSEVRFHYVPVQAREPQPADGAADVALTASMNWRPGREATSHKVFFGTDSNAVAAGTASASTVTDHSYTPAAMTFGAKYFWKVDEVGDAGTYAGDVWSFTAQEFAPLDDFEGYTDDEGSRIYEAWFDGIADTVYGGSTVGYMQAPFAEQVIVHAGKQSMPLAYDNTKAPFFSEAVKEFETPQNCTGSGAAEVCVWTRGYPAVPTAAVTETGGKISLTTAGGDIWNTCDDFTYIYKTLNGDGAMVARVTSVGDGTSTWAKGGVMIRDAISGGSKHAMMVITAGGGNGASFQYRSAADGASGNTDSTPVVAAPYWVKLERSGDIFTGSVSSDGKTWTQTGTTTLPMDDPVLIGLAASSGVVDVARTFQFESVTGTGSITGSWVQSDIDVAQYNDASPMYLTITDSAGKSATVVSDTAATAAAWTRWAIPMSSFNGVSFSKVKKLTIGVGAKGATTGGSGTVFIDDIGFGRSAQ